MIADKISKTKQRLIRIRLGTDRWLLVLPLARWPRGYKDPDAIGAGFGTPFDFFICKITHWHPQTKKTHTECVSNPYLIAGRGGNQMRQYMQGVLDVDWKSWISHQR
jgi:hypothetical protein